MSEIDILITLTGVTMAFAVLSVQGYMFGNLLAGKLLELYDIYMIKKKVPGGLCYCGDMDKNHGYHSNHSIVYAVDYGIEKAKKWSRG